MLLFRPIHSRRPSPPSLSLHDALPISSSRSKSQSRTCPSSLFRTSSFTGPVPSGAGTPNDDVLKSDDRSEEHTSELQSHHDLVCRLLLEKKKTQQTSMLHLLAPKVHFP